jgi:hypothetical protein
LVAAGDSDAEIVDARWPTLVLAALGVGEVLVAAIEDGVIGG